MSKMKLFRSAKRLFTLFVVVLSLFTMLVAQPVSAIFAADINVDSLYYLANQERLDNNLQPLTLNDKLSQAALDKANYMFANNYWDHNAPDGTEPWAFIRSSGYDYKSAGENLAKDFDHSVDVIAGWMDSPTHKANVLDVSYADVGYAVVNGVLLDKETTLVVAMYGNPKLAVSKTQSGGSAVTVSVIIGETGENSTVSTSSAGVLSGNTSQNIMQGLVKGVMDLRPVAVYLSASQDVKLIIMIVCLILLSVLVRLLLSDIKDRRGYRCVWFKKSPIIGSILLIATFAIAVASSLGVVLG